MQQVLPLDMDVYDSRAVLGRWRPQWRSSTLTWIISGTTAHR